MREKLTPRCLIPQLHAPKRYQTLLQRPPRCLIPQLHAPKRYQTLLQRPVAAPGLHDIAPDTPWAFSPTLKRYASGEAVDLPAYLLPHP